MHLENGHPTGPCPGPLSGERISIWISNPSEYFEFAFSDEIKRGDVVFRRFFDGEVVVYRTASVGISGGTLTFLPNLGAHFGKGGGGNEENLRCRSMAFPFHKKVA